MLFSVAVFVFCKYEVRHIRILNSINEKYINLLASYGLGVYLIHMYFIILLPKEVTILLMTRRMVLCIRSIRNWQIMKKTLSSAEGLESTSTMIWML